MERQTNSLRRRRDRNRQANKRSNQQKILILLILTFILGFVLGFLIGSNREKEINFVLPESTPAVSETTIETPEKTIPKNLPWNLTLVNFEHPLDEKFKPTELTEVDHGIRLIQPCCIPKFAANTGLRKLRFLFLEVGI